MSAPEEPMEQRPDLATRLRAKANALALELPEAIHDDVAPDMRAAADIVEAHQRLLDAIGDPDELRQWVEEINGIMLRKFAARVADAVAGKCVDCFGHGRAIYCGYFLEAPCPTCGGTGTTRDGAS